METLFKTANDLSILKLIEDKLENSNMPSNINSLAQICSRLKIRGHLAILTEPYLNKILEGEKTIESRFSKSRIPPFQKINENDILFLKQSSGPIRAIAIVSKVNFYGPLKPGEAEKIINKFQDGLRAENSFILSKKNSIYGTLIYLDEVIPINPFPLIKSDRRPWIVLTKYIISDEGISPQLALFSN